MMVLGEISRQPSIDCVVWLLVVTIRQIYMKGKIQNVQFEEKGSNRKCNGAKSSAQGYKKKFKENLMLNGIERVVTSGQDSTQLSFQFVERYRKA